jgi:hypothetical protein
MMFPDIVLDVPKLLRESKRGFAPLLKKYFPSPLTPRKERGIQGVR